LKDANGCSDFVTRTITQPALLTVTTSSIEKACFGQNNGAINITVIGGKGTKTYSWTSSPSGYTSSVRNPSNMSAGNYSVLVTDANGCTAELNNVTVALFGEIIVNSSITNVLYSGASTGAIDLTVSGGTGSGFTYSWTGAATSTNQDLSNLGASANYKVRITDVGSGCFVDRIFAVTQTNALSVITIQNTSSLFSTGLRGTGSGSTALRSIFLGENAGYNATNASNSNFFGSNAGNATTDAYNSNFFGFQSGLQATNAYNSNFFGLGTGQYATNANNSNFIGFEAGYGASNANTSNLFGFQAGKSISGNNIGSNNIIIGTNISLPNATANAINLGGVLFGTGTYSTTSGTPSITSNTGGRIGILSVSPVATLDVNGDAILSGTSRYLNFGTNSGTSGYGFRDNAGTIEYKNNGGSWAAFGGSGGGAPGGNQYSIQYNSAGAFAGNANFVYDADYGRLIVGAAPTTGSALLNDPRNKFLVNGNIVATKVKVTQTGWPDYVFEEKYPLLPLSELSQFVKSNKHLPEIPTEKEISENGLDLGDMNALLLKKVEELTLYVINLQKQVDELKNKKGKKPKKN
jgi:hypothetical protein